MELFVARFVLRVFKRKKNHRVSFSIFSMYSGNPMNRKIVTTRVCTDEGKGKILRISDKILTSKSHEDDKDVEEFDNFEVFSKILLPSKVFSKNTKTRESETILPGILGQKCRFTLISGFDTQTQKAKLLPNIFGILAIQQCSGSKILRAQFSQNPVDVSSRPNFQNFNFPTRNSNFSRRKMGILEIRDEPRRLVRALELSVHYVGYKTENSNLRDSKNGF